MAPTNFLDRRVRARKDDDDSPEELSDSEPPAAEDSEPEFGSDSDSDNTPSQPSDDESHHDSDSEASSTSQPPSPHAALAEISFGALASAQASLGPSKKRKRSSHDPRNASSRSPSPFHEAEERAAGKKASNPSRTSKHAPTELSSKKAVSRKRSVIPAAVATPRDPRFSALSGRVNQDKVQKNYSFLNEYRASEIAELKARMKKEKNEGAKEALKREVRAMEDRERARKRAEEEREVVGEHKRQERARVKEGKKPFFLKKGEVKKQVLVKRFEGMGEKRAEKAMEKKRKRKAQKERRSMPDARRGAEV